MKNFKTLTTYEKINQVAFYVIGAVMGGMFIAGVIIAVYHIVTRSAHTPTDL